MSYQVNNLKVRLNISTNKWIVITLDGRILEEFRFEKDAILFAQDTHDFLTKVGKQRKYGFYQ